MHCSREHTVDAHISSVSPREMPHCHFHTMFNAFAQQPPFACNVHANNIMLCLNSRSYVMLLAEA